jgi:hypothetical protein
MEQQSKILVNDVLTSGVALTNVEKIGQERTDMDNMMGRAHTYHDMLDQFATRSQLPADTVSVVAPINHTVHGMERVVAPAEMQAEELAFQRLVALSCGLPLSVMHAEEKQGGGDGGNAIEVANRQLLSTCRRLNEHLELLLMAVYAKIYGNQVRFRLTVAPTLSLEQLVTIHEARLMDDEGISRIVEASWGAPLSKEARAVREQKHKSEFVLPFRDKKTTR